MIITAGLWSSLRSPVNNTHLLHGKDLVVEVTLKLLVCKINTELLKTILIKVFKSEDVENSKDKLVGLRVGLEVAIQFGHYPLEHSSIEGFGQPVTNIRCLGHSVAFVYHFTCNACMETLEEHAWTIITI